MVDDLWNANGSAAASRAPYPVVEFALRIRGLLRQQQARLLDEQREFVAPSDREEVVSALRDEENALYLVVELIESKSQSRPGEIERLRHSFFITTTLAPLSRGAQRSSR